MVKLPDFFSRRITGAKELFRGSEPRKANKPIDFPERRLRGGKGHLNQRETRKLVYSRKLFLTTRKKVEIIKEKEWTREDLIRDKITPHTMKAHSFTPAQIREVGFTLKDMIFDGFTDKELLKANFTSTEIKDVRTKKV